jgi:hypothetical protein
LIISDDPSFIFIAVPKTGSCSIEEALKPWQNRVLKRKFNKHATSMRLNRELPAKRWQQSYRFAIVREPYAWMHSWYRFRQREELKNPEHAFNKRYTGNISFDEFVQTFSENELMLKQSDFIARHNGELLVDFVGRYETLQDDFDRVCEHLALPQKNLPRVNVSKATNASEGLLETASIAIINDYFSQDFEMFGYAKR